MLLENAGPAHLHVPAIHVPAGAHRALRAWRQEVESKKYYSIASPHPTDCAVATRHKTLPPQSSHSDFFYARQLFAQPNLILCVPKDFGGGQNVRKCPEIT